MNSVTNTMTGRLTAVATVLLLGVVLAAPPLSAQRGGDGDRANQRRAFAPQAQRGGVETILGMRETLELSSEQIAELNAIRIEQLEQRASQMVEAMRVRSDLVAGEITREEMLERFDGTRGSRAAQIEALRTQVNDVLTTEQRVAVLEMRNRRSRRGQGIRGQREGRRGGDGPPRRERRGPGDAPE